MTWHVPVNFASTTVSTSALDNTTSPVSFGVADGTVFGSTFPLWAVVDPSGTREVIEVTARSTNTLTATRPSAVAHAGTPRIIVAPSAEYITELQTAMDGFVPADQSAWNIDIDVYGMTVSNTNFNTITLDSNALHFAILYSGGAQNDEVCWDVYLGAGNWSASILHTRTANAGIYSFLIDGVSKGTTDGYNASSSYNHRGSAITWTQSTSGKVRVTLKMASKNASSSGYYGFLQGLKLWRTV